MSCFGCVRISFKIAVCFCFFCIFLVSISIRGSLQTAESVSSVDKLVVPRIVKIISVYSEGLPNYGACRVSNKIRFLFSQNKNLKFKTYNKEYFLSFNDSKISYELKKFRAKETVINILADKPDFVCIFGDVAFSLLAFDLMKRKDFKGFLIFQGVFQKIPKQFVDNKRVFVVRTETVVNKINSFFSKAQIPLDNYYVISSNDSESYFRKTKIKNELLQDKRIAKSSIKFFNVNNVFQLRTTLSKISSLDKGVLLFNVKYLYDTELKRTIYAPDLLRILNSMNFKHLEVSFYFFAFLLHKTAISVSVSAEREAHLIFSIMLKQISNIFDYNKDFKDVGLLLCVNLARVNFLGYDYLHRKSSLNVDDFVDE